MEYELDFEPGSWEEVEFFTEKVFQDIRFDGDYDEDQSGVVYNACLNHLLESDNALRRAEQAA